METRNLTCIGCPMGCPLTSENRKWNRIKCRRKYL